jgi:hypothetical protein
VVVLDAFIVV